MVVDFVGWKNNESEGRENVVMLPNTVQSDRLKHCTEATIVEIRRLCGEK